MRKIPRKFTVELIIDLCKNYKTRADIIRNDSSLYNYMRKNKLLDDFFPIRYAKKEISETDISYFKQCASNCKTIKDLNIQHKGIYNKIKRYGLEDICLNHMISTKQSRPQKICQNILEQLLNKISLYNNRKILKNQLELDIFFPDYNLAMEYDGSYWHKNKDRDDLKNKICEDMGIALIRIIEPIGGFYNNTDKCVYFIKQEIIKNIDIINKKSNNDFTVEDIEKINVNFDKILNELYDVNDIMYATTQCTTYAQFERNYNKYYEYLRRNKMLNLLAHLPKKQIIDWKNKSDDDIINLVMTKYVKYIDFIKDRKLYDISIYRNLLTKIKKTLCLRRIFKDEYPDDFLIKEYTNKYNSYSDFRLSKDYSRGKYRKILKQIKLNLKSKNT